MRKWIAVLVTSIFILALAACGNSDDKDNKTLVIGATNEPHGMILEKAKPLLKEKGIDLEVKVFSKYELINPALADKSLDANYFQHIPYLEAQMEKFGYEFENAGGIHIEPIGVYSKKYKSLEELPDGATIILSNSTPDHGRILTLLEANGLIKLKDGVDKITASFDDIAENPKNIKFKYDYAPDLLPTIFNNNEGDAVVINSNYAIDAGLNPVEDNIAIEDADSPYVNVIAVRKGDAKKEEIQALIEVLHTKEIKDYILETWNGAVVPVDQE